MTLRFAFLPLLFVSTLLVSTPVGAQGYQSPATVAKNLKAQCAGLPPAQRPACEQRAKTETKASIVRHHEHKRRSAEQLAQQRKLQQAEKGRPAPKAGAKPPPAATVTPKK